MVIGFVPQVSLAVGVPKSSAVPHSLVWLAGQKVKVGLVVSTVAMVWLQVLVSAQPTSATQARLTIECFPQLKMVKALRTLIVFVPELSLLVGGPTSSAGHRSLVRLS